MGSQYNWNWVAGKMRILPPSTYTLITHHTRTHTHRLEHRQEPPRVRDFWLVTQLVQQPRGGTRLYVSLLLAFVLEGVGLSLLLACRGHQATRIRDQPARLPRLDCGRVGQQPRRGGTLCACVRVGTTNSRVYAVLAVFWRNHPGV